MANPAREHRNTVKRILRYVKGTSNVALCYGGSKFTVRGYVDLDFVGDLDKRKSTTGYVFARAGAVAIHYYGRLAAKQGWRFDSTYDHKDGNGEPVPFVFVLGSGKVISGIEAAVRSMKVGGIRRVIIPPSQGYQNTSQEPLPPNVTSSSQQLLAIYPSPCVDNRQAKFQLQGLEFCPFYSHEVLCFESSSPKTVTPLPSPLPLLC
ncbi:Peptidyl-prolyl cis-trans isomerase FKBP17-1 [Morus notabilis]|uniref:peptidylprolyl isomerase n=1 Tax=Morus notabilis TaxID=981085 RepID=W9RJL0_9ROSA|nr:Peptidyl-prolyl cis-trans isomerase FKBP17-1 [Morus notabilis]